MKTTFDLPDPLLRRAKAVAADQGRPLRDLVAEALDEKLAAHAGAKRAGNAQGEWKQFAARLQKLPDGSFINPEGFEDDTFHQVLETLREERRGWQPRNPFEDAAAFTPVPDAAEKRKGKRTPVKPRTKG